MSTSQDQSGCSSNREPLLRCCDARRDLELAIGEVLRAEQQIKDNLREVWRILFSSLVWTLARGWWAWPRAWLLSANLKVLPHAWKGLLAMLVPLFPKGNKADVRRVWKTLYHFREFSSTCIFDCSSLWSLCQALPPIKQQNEWAAYCSAVSLMCFSMSLTIF